MAAVRCCEDKFRNIALFQMRRQAFFQNIQELANPRRNNLLMVCCNLNLGAKNRKLRLKVWVLKVCQNFLNHFPFIRVISSVLYLEVFTNCLPNSAYFSNFFRSIGECNLFLSNLICFYRLRSVDSQVLRELVFIFHVQCL